jgi:hypothetical protein
MKIGGAGPNAAPAIVIHMVAGRSFCNIFAPEKISSSSKVVSDLTIGDEAAYSQLFLLVAGSKW